MTGTFLRAPDGAIRAPWQLAIFGGGIFVAGGLIGGIGIAIAEATPIARWARLAHIPLGQIANLAAIAAGVYLWGRFTAPGASPWASTRIGRGAWNARSLLQGSLAGAAVILLPVTFLVVFGAARFVPSESTDSVPVALWAGAALMVPAALSEELLFRGPVLMIVERRMGSRAAIAITSVLFGLAHLFNPSPTIASITGVVVAGVWLGAIRVATGSLAAAFAAHFCVNFAQAEIVHAPLSGFALPLPGYRFESLGPDWVTGGTWGPEGGAAVVAAFAVATFIISKRTPHAPNSDA